MSYISNLIAERRKDLGLTLEQVGSYVGVGKSTVRKWERGIIAEIRRDKIKKLCEILKIDPVLMISLSESASSPQIRNHEESLDDELLKTLPLLSPQETEELTKYMRLLIAARKED